MSKSKVLSQMGYDSQLEFETAGEVLVKIALRRGFGEISAH
jgi:hypothetical protein